MSFCLFIAYYILDFLEAIISNIISIGDSIDSALNLNNNNNTEENNNNYKTGIELLMGGGF